MANSIRINATKGGESAITVIIATLASQAIVQGLKSLGIDVDNIQVLTAVTALLAAAISWGKNWWKHRKDKPTTITPVEDGATR